MKNNKILKDIEELLQQLEIDNIEVTVEVETDKIKPIKRTKKGFWSWLKRK